MQLHSTQSQSAEHSTEAGLQDAVHLPDSFIDGGGDQVLQHLRITGFRNFRIDNDLEYVLPAIHLDTDAAASSGRLDHSVLHFLLQGLVLASRLRQQVLKVESAHESSNLKAGRSSAGYFLSR